MNMQEQHGQVGFSRVIDIRRLLMAAAMVACIVNAAHAEGITPRHESVITADSVTVGDVFSGVTHDAGYVLAPAPAPGKTLTLSAHDLQRVSDAFNFGWYPETGHEQVVIRRSAHEVDRYMIEAALQKKLQAQLKGQKFDIQLDDRSLVLVVPETAPADVSVGGLSYDLAHGTFRAQLSAAAGTVRRDVTGRIFPLTAVPVLKTARMPGDTITASDIDYVDTRASDIAASTVTDPAKLIGMTPRRTIAPLKPISASDVVLPPLVKKGDLVSLELKNGAIFVTSQGRALEDGVEGDTVRVSNTSSNQIVQGVVTALKTVTIAPPATVQIPPSGT